MTTAPRPLVHHTPVSGWVNDPLGLTFHDGRYHLFFQYVPDSTTWDVACHWGHATSDDLLTWTPEPPALSPGDGEDGVWSGNLVRTAAGDAVAFYTAVDAENREIGRVRRAVPTNASWREWTKEEVVVRLPEDEPAVAFRDPFVYADGAGWRMLMGGGLPGGVPVVWMFTSADLRSWTYAGRALEGGPGPSTIWECPVLVDIGGRQALVVSDCEPGAPLHVAYAWVEAVGDRFDAGPWRRLGYGSYYAASTFLDADGRPGLVHWVREVIDTDAGWAGVTSLPHLLERDGERLVARPHPALDGVSTLLDRRGSLGGSAVTDVEWQPAADDELVPRAGLTLAVAADVLTVRSGARVATMPWRGGPLRVVVDGPVLEVFGADGVLALPVD
ncbi:MAG: glycoside hydrolase family 32 protein [Nocardioides sp.]